MKTAVVLGATSGIGRELARLLVRDGWTVGAAGRRIPELEALREELGEDKVRICRIDITLPDASEKMLGLIDDIGGMDMYLHVSGVGHQNYGLDPQIEIGTVKTNAEGMVRMVDTAFNYFKDRKEAGRQTGGHIVVVSSVAGTKGLGAATSYSATKKMQWTYVDALAQLSRMRGYNISFTDVRPGFVATDILRPDRHYPMLMGKEKASELIYRSIIRRKRVAVIDWRYALFVFWWRLIPQCLWERMTLVRKFISQE